MAAFINGNVVAIPDEVVADIELVLKPVEVTVAEHVAAAQRLQTFLKTYKESN